MAGIPLNRVHEFNLHPGEIRYDVTMDNIINSMPSEEKRLEYMASIDRGRELLIKARDDPSQFKEVEKDAIDYFQAMTKTSKKATNLERKDEISPSQYLSLLTIGLLGLISKRLPPQDTTDIQEDESQEKDLMRSNEVEDSPELQRMEKLIAIASFEIPEMKEKEREERIAKANSAMAEYLNKDDGGDDWLDHMSNLMHDE